MYVYFNFVEISCSFKKSSGRSQLILSLSKNLEDEEDSSERIISYSLYKFYLNIINL